MNKIVHVEITDAGDNKLNILYLVNYMGGMYGGGSPCYNELEVWECVKNAKEVITKEGDKPVVNDLRAKSSLLAFMKPQSI